MTISKEEITNILKKYDKKKITIATVCSHSSLQIFNGAKQEGFKTLGIAIKQVPKVYNAFPYGRADDFLVVDDYEDIIVKADELVKRNVILIPSGSFVEYLSPTKFKDELCVPTFGNRKVLEWEADRERQKEWLEAAGVRHPPAIDNPDKIQGPVMVKYHGAKGGRGFFIAKNKQEFREGIDWRKKFTIQKYILGTRYYPQFFYSPFQRDPKNEYTLNSGSLQLLSMDRRDETNIDEMYKLGAQELLKKEGISPTFVVTGNIPIVLRESLLPEIFDFAEKVVKKSFDLFDGMIGPFCLEGVFTDELKFYIFEISARIVAGTNPFIQGSPYSSLAFNKPMSTGRRIADEIRYALSVNQLDKVIS